MIRNYLKRIIFILLTLIMGLSCNDSRVPFEDFLESIKTDSAEQQNRLLEHYIKRSPVLPVIEDTNVYFVLKDSTGQKNYLTGDMVQWKADSLAMQRIGESDYYYLKQVYPSDSRLEYKFIIGNSYVLDPQNPRKDRGGYGYNSVLMMPFYKFPKEILLNKTYPGGKLDTLEYKSRQLKNKRSIFFYRHPQATAESKMVIVHDGGDYLNFVEAKIILDNLIAEEQIPPVHVLFVNPVERMKEYWFDDRYLKMIFDELLPFVRNKYKLSTAERVAMGGASLGGLISLYALQSYADELDFVFSQSGAFWIDDEKIVDILRKKNFPDTKVYLGYGSFEQISEVHEKLSALLDQKGCRYLINKPNEGHNWGHWRAHLGEALRFGLTRQVNYE